MAIRRAASVSVVDGVVVPYVHNAVKPGLGKIGVLVALESTGDKAKLAELGKQIAMHVAAAAPQRLSTDDPDPAAVERERAVLVEPARATGKPDNLIEKMIEGRYRQFHQ